MMDGDRTWHTCEIAVRESRSEPDKRNHQKIQKRNMIRTDQDWFRWIQVLPLRQSEEPTWMDLAQRQWSTMIGVRSCRLFKRSCCAMSQKPLHLAVPRMTALLRLLATSSTRNGRILWVSEPKCMRDVSTKYGSHVAVVSIFFIFDVVISFWLATPDCCMYGLFEIDCVMLWILYFLLISSFQVTEGSTFWHKQTIAYDG